MTTKLIDILKFIESKPHTAFFYTPPIYNGKCYFFKKADYSFKGQSLDEINELFNRVDKFRTEGKIGYALIPYEVGYLFEERLSEFVNENSDELELFFSDEKNVDVFHSHQLELSEADLILNKKVNPVSNFRLNVSKEKFIEDVKKIKAYIKEGDTYQVNYTAEGKFNLNISPSELFIRLIFNQSANYSCMINTGEKIILSISPELFFRVEGDEISVKPMKGTSPRGKNLEEDKLNQKLLFESRKDRAENVMIVDLLRNDLGRISKFNSVEPKELYKIEKYETVFQMVSEIKAKLDKNSFSEIIKNLFPCGSITGAPKIRTMRIIKELEKRNRGIYTGTIGLIEKETLNFNVAIRTIELKNGIGKIGLGSGIVWDSDPEAEYNETLSKGKFLSESVNYFEIFESILFENGDYFLLEDHINRLQETANYFLFKFDRKSMLNKLELEKKNFDNDKKYKIRISLGKWGAINLDFAEIDNDVKLIKVILSDKRVNAGNRFLYFKTTERKLYDEEFWKAKQTGYDEVLFLNEDGYITEGAISNIFIKKKNEWKTPSLNGLLAGVFRNKYIEENDVKEDLLTLNDLKNSTNIIMTNSVRKIREVIEIADSSGNILYRKKEISQ